MSCQKIISGGQTGVDRGVLDAALELCFPCGGWCPEGKTAEDGILDKKYPLKEISGGSCADRTKMNVSDSDGTLIIFNDKLSGGTLLTFEIAKSLNKKIFLLSENDIEKNSVTDTLKEWIETNHIRTLNVAGPRASEWTKGYQIGNEIIKKLILKLKS